MSATTYAPSHQESFKKSLITGLAVVAGSMLISAIERKTRRKFFGPILTFAAMAAVKQAAKHFTSQHHEVGPSKTHLDEVKQLASDEGM